VSACKCPNSTSTGVDITVTGAFLESEGCRLAPVMEASKKRTATPLGGVSPIVKLMGILFVLPIGAAFEEPPQAANKTQLETASAVKTFRHIRNPPVGKPVSRNPRLGIEGG
jgi:hypothetical protein